MISFISSGIKVPSASNQIFAFGGTATAPPPTKPPSTLTTGGWCIRATCDLMDINNKKIGDVKGFDTKGNIAERVSNTCKWKKNSKKGQWCSDVELTMLSARADLICSGQIYFQLADNVKKVV